MSISNISSYGNIFESQAVRHAKNRYNQLYLSSYVRTAKGDSVSISPEAKQKLQESTSALVYGMSANSMAIDPDAMTVGLAGEADFTTVDAIYIPQAILDAMPSRDDYIRAYGLFDFSSGGESPIGKEPGALEELLNIQEKVSGLWAKYKETLSDYGLDYKDAAAMNDFLKDKELRGKVEQDFESRL